MQAIVLLSLFCVALAQIPGLPSDTFLNYVYGNQINQDNYPGDDDVEITTQEPTTVIETTTTTSAPEMETAPAPLPRPVHPPTGSPWFAVSYIIITLVIICLIKLSFILWRLKHIKKLLTRANSYCQTGQIRLMEEEVESSL